MENQLTGVDLNTLKPTLIRLSLKQKYQWLVKNIDPDEACLQLKYKVLTEEEVEHVERQGVNKGMIAQAKLLVDYIIKKNDSELRTLLSVLRDDFLQPFVFEEILKTIRRPDSGDIHVYESMLQENGAKMRRMYQDTKFNIISCLPGENLLLDLSNSEAVMPFEFETKIAKWDSNKLHFKSKYEVEPYYSLTSYDTIGNILDALHSNDGDGRLVLVTGNPGCGKTVLVHSLVTEWMLLNYKWAEWYQLVFTIVLREVDVNSKLIDIIANMTKGCIGSKDKVVDLEMYLKSKQTAQHVMIILDGIDEKDIQEGSEIYQLITGKIYPYVKVVATSRPDASSFSNLQMCAADYTVNLKGTTKEGVYHYLEYVLTGGGVQDNRPNKDVVHSLVKICEERMIEFHLLQIPLYLTLLAFVFDNYWVQELTFTDMMIPKTTTELFTTIILVKLCIWLKRLGRKDEANSLKIGTCPMSKESNLAMDMRRTLKALGQMCWEFLLKQQYEVPIQNLDEYDIDINDIINSGLFEIYESKEGRQLHFCHKQLQEFTAAIYLAQTGFKDVWLCQRVEAAKKDETRITLRQLFFPVESVIPFLFGMSTDVSLNILHKISAYIGVPAVLDDDSRRAVKYIDLSFEAQLFFESTDESVKSVLKELILDAPLLESGNCEKKQPFLPSLYQSFSLGQRAQLLQRWFGIEVSGSDQKWEICNTASSGQDQYQGSGLKIEHFTRNIYMLLSEFIFPAVTCLHLEFSNIVSVGLLQRVFPELYCLYIDGHTQFDNRLIKALNLNDIQETKQSQLSSLIVVMLSKGPPLTPYSVQSILQQPQLQYLSLFGYDILTYLKDANHQPRWGNISTLNMDFFTFNQEDDKVKGLMSLLTAENLPLLNALYLGCRDKIQDQETVNKILVCVYKLPLLRTLQLGLKHHSLCTQVYQTLPGTQQLRNLNTLGLRLSGTREEMNVIADLLEKLPQIHTFQVIHWGNRQSEIESMCRKLQQQLLKSDPPKQTAVTCFNLCSHFQYCDEK